MSCKWVTQKGHLHGRLQMLHTYIRLSQRTSESQTQNETQNTSSRNDARIVS